MNRTLAVLLMLLPLICGCGEKEQLEKSNGRFTLIRPSQDAFGNPIRNIRFNTVKEKDAKTLAYEKVAQDWNRNLIIGCRPHNEVDSLNLLH